MSFIRLDVANVLASAEGLTPAQNTVNKVKGTLASISRSVPGSVMGRNSIAQNFHSIDASLSALSGQIGSIKAVSDRGVNLYNRTDYNNNSMAKEICENQKMLVPEKNAANWQAFLPTVVMGGNDANVRKKKKKKDDDNT